MVIEERDVPDDALGATHVFIIGIGDYPWLDGGATPRGENITGGMTQLSAPPISARKFADWWLSEYRDNERPLASVSMLLSDSESQIYAAPDQKQHDIPPATIDNIRDAADIWSERGRENPENQLVFFFSGHGLASGVQEALLTRDYGERAARPMLGAINLTGFKIGLSSLPARRQLLFIDACRTGRNILLRNSNDNGDVLVPTGDVPTNDLLQNIYRASLNGRPAYGLPNGLTLFTRGVLNAFRGAGADNLDDQHVWRLNTGMIGQALTHFATQLADPEHGLAQRPKMEDFSSYHFHRFVNAPAIPVYVRVPSHDGDSDDVMPCEHIISLNVHHAGEVIVNWPLPWHNVDHCSWGPERFLCWLHPDRHYDVTVSFNGGVPAAVGGRHVVTPYGLIEVN